MLPDMMTAFRQMRDIHERLKTLDLCNRMQIDVPTSARNAELIHEMTDPGPANLTDLFADTTHDWLHRADAQIAQMRAHLRDTPKHQEDLIATALHNT